MQASTLIAYIIAIAIPAFAVYLIFALDLFATGKGSTVLACVAWGAVGAFLIAREVNNRLLLPAVGYESLTGFWGPLVEEICKALALMYLIQRPRFRYIVDGAVYGFAVGIGFAVSENLFVYMPLNQNAPIVGMLTRILSATLMHATASALVGIAFGRLRRARQGERLAVIGWFALGITLAIGAHVLYNNAVASQMEGTLLLLIAVGMGAVGFIVIFSLVNQGLAAEKKRFAETLGLNVGVSSSERRAVQQFGGDAVEKILTDLADFFGVDKVARIRRLLVIQANIGILQGNLGSPASERLRKAWQEEISGLRAEINQLRKDLGVYVMSFLRGVFPEQDMDWADKFSQEIRKSDPTQIHSFDIFIRASEMAGTLSPDQLERTAALLQRAEIFKDVSLADLENLSRAVTTQNFQDSEVIFNEGDEGDTLYLIRQGSIDLYKRDSDGEALLRTCQAGEVVGELALLDGYPRSAKAQAKGQVTALRLRREHFLMFIQSRPQVIIALLRFLANRVRTTSDALERAFDWVTNIAEGNFREAQMIGVSVVAQTPAIQAADVGAMPEDTAGLSVSTDSAVLTPAMLGGAFSKVAAALENRERKRDIFASAARSVDARSGADGETRADAGAQKEN